MNYKYIAGAAAVVIAASIVFLSTDTGSNPPGGEQRLPAISPEGAQLKNGVADHARSEKMPLEEGASAVTSPTASMNGFANDVLNCLLMRSQDDRHRTFLEFMKKMRPGDAAEVRNLFARFDKAGVAFPVEWRAFLRRWGEIAPLAAIETLGDSKHARSDRLSHIFQGWAASDASAAQTWLSHNTNHPHFNRAFLGFLDGLSRVDIQAATRFTMTSLASDDPLLAEAMMRLTDEINRTSTAVGLKNWFSQIPEDVASRPAKQIAARSIYQTLLKHGLNVAMDWAQTQPLLANDPAVIRDMAIRSAASDPPAAMTMITSVPPDAKSGYDGLGYVVREWAAKDQSAFERWLTSNRGEPIFQQAAHDYAHVLAANDREKAIYWANQVSTPSLRTTLMNRLESGAPPPRWVTRKIEGNP